MSHTRRAPVWASNKPYDDGTSTSFDILTTILAQRMHRERQEGKATAAPQPVTTGSTASMEPSIPDVSFKGNPRSAIGQRREGAAVAGMTAAPCTETVGRGEDGPSPLSDEVSLTAGSPNEAAPSATLSSGDFQRTDTFASPSPEKKLRDGNQRRTVVVEPPQLSENEGASFKTQWLPSALLADNSSSSRYALDDDDDDAGGSDVGGWLGQHTTTRRSETAMGDTTFFCDGPTAIVSEAGGRSMAAIPRLGASTVNDDEYEEENFDCNPQVQCLSPPAGVDATYTTQKRTNDQPNEIAALHRNAATETMDRYGVRPHRTTTTTTTTNSPRDVTSVASKLPQVDHINAQIREQMEKLATRDAAIHSHRPQQQPTARGGRSAGGLDEQLHGGPTTPPPLATTDEQRQELAHYLFSLKQQVVMLSQLVAAQPHHHDVAGGAPQLHGGGGPPLPFATTNSSAEFGSLRSKRRANQHLHSGGNPVTVHVVRDYDLPVVPYARKPPPPPPPLAAKLSKTFNSTYTASSAQYSSDFTASGDFQQGFGKSRTSSIPEDSIATALSATWDR